MNSANGGNCRRQNALAPEVARHQQVTDLALFAFNSRRLHHSTRLSPARRQAKPRSWQAFHWSNALSERSESKGTRRG